MNLLQKMLRIFSLLLGLMVLILLGWRFRLHQQEKNALKKFSQPMNGYGTVEPFTLTDQQGQPRGLQDLQGKVWVADFIFTRCQGPCPVISSRMSLLQKEFPQEKLNFVSFTVDPNNDTVDILRSYAQGFKADPARWFFLTGPKEKIYALIKNSFHLAIEPGGNDDFIHSLHFVLVDSEGHIQGYYNMNDPDSLIKIREDLKKFLSA